jgi:hypothetical protein
MEKYTSIQEAVYSVFSSPAYQAENIQTYPQNFQGEVGSTEYLKVFILIGKTLPIYSNAYTGAGQIIIDIFTPAGAGTGRAFIIADILDKYFANKVLGSPGNGIQTSPSTLVQLGIYAENPSLYKCSYTINFSYFGGT